MVEIEINYDGELRCSAKHGLSEAIIETDAPIDNHGRGEAFSPTDLCASSLGVCMLTILGIVAKDHEVDIGDVRGRVIKEMSSDLPRRIAKITVEIEVPLPADHPKRELIEQAAMSCPVHFSLHPDIQKEVSWKWING
ncbi:MAG: OsmC family protein [Verrucomicrobiota bacterium]|nr:OsmC family protein [Verrucomicrobiota bacterium]